jgi:proteasome lid subunit RPN8/RPN11
MAIEMKKLSTGPLRGMGYDAAARKMVIETTTGKFEYTNISPEFYRRFATASSPLSFYRDNIEEEMSGRKV